MERVLAGQGSDELGAGIRAADYAFLIMNKNQAGQSISQVMGNFWFDILAVPPTSGQIYHEGYPALGVFDTWCPFQHNSNSCYIWFCNTSIASYRQVYTGWWEVIIGCDTGPGASGWTLVPVQQWLAHRLGREHGLGNGRHARLRPRATWAVVRVYG